MKNVKAERELSLDFLRVTEAAAIESAKTMGQGDRKYSDHVAVEAMRKAMDLVPMRGTIVIGEGGSGGFLVGTGDTGDDGDDVMDEEVNEPIHENEAVLTRRASEAIGRDVIDEINEVANDPNVSDEELLPKIIEMLQTVGSQERQFNRDLSAIARGR